MNELQILIGLYPNKFWDWGEFGLSVNMAITPEFVEKFIDKPWHWGELWFK